jgi:hypothetical protein
MHSYLRWNRGSELDVQALCHPWTSYWFLGMTPRDNWLRPFSVYRTNFDTATYLTALHSLS